MSKFDKEFLREITGEYLSLTFFNGAYECILNIDLYKESNVYYLPFYINDFCGKAPLQIIIR